MKEDLPNEETTSSPSVADINVTPMVDVMLCCDHLYCHHAHAFERNQRDMVKTKNPIKMAAADKEDAVLSR